MGCCGEKNRIEVRAKAASASGGLCALGSFWDLHEKIDRPVAPLVAGDCGKMGREALSGTGLRDKDWLCGSLWEDHSAGLVRLLHAVTQPLVHLRIPCVSPPNRMDQKDFQGPCRFCVGPSPCQLPACHQAQKPSVRRFWLQLRTCQWQNTGIRGPRRIQLLRRSQPRTLHWRKPPWPLRRRQGRKSAHWE